MNTKNDHTELTVKKWECDSGDTRGNVWDKRGIEEGTNITILRMFSILGAEMVENIDIFFNISWVELLYLNVAYLMIM